MTIAGYVPAIGETDLNKIIRSIRNLYENGAAAADVAAAGVVAAGPGCGLFSYVSANAVKFAPFNGNLINIAGTTYQIPSAAISGGTSSVLVDGVAGQNLAVSTVYNAYVFNNAGTPAIDWSTTGHSTDTTAGNIGVEIKTGDNSRSLIGKVRTNASGQFADAATQRFVRSWFNRQTAALIFALTSNTTSTSTSFAELTSLARLEFVSFANEIVSARFSGATSNSSTTANASSVGFNGATAEDGGIYSDVSASAVQGFSAQTVKTGLTEGYNYVTPVVRVDAGTGTWQGSANAGRRSTITAEVRP